MEIETTPEDFDKARAALGVLNQVTAIIRAVARAIATERHLTLLHDKR